MNVFRSIVFVGFGLFVVACSSEQEAQAADASTDPASDTQAANSQANSSQANQAVLPNAALDQKIEALETDLSKDEARKVIARFAAFRQDIGIRSLKKTGLPGVYQAELTEGSFLYFSEAGDHFIAGEMYKFDATGDVVSITEETRIARRIDALATLDRKEFVSFGAEGDDVTDIYVFTDVHCGYCVKLHQEVEALGELGIRVNYLAFPRGGARSQAYPIMQSIWCSDDRQKAMTDAKSGSTIPSVQCDSNAVMDQFALGASIGVNATPAIMFADGSLQLGYVPSAQLAAVAKARR